MGVFRRAVRALTPEGWRHLVFQIALLGSFEVVYALSGLFGRAHAGEGVANARSLVSFEQRAGVAWEHGLQNWVLHGPSVFLELANRTYFVSQFTVSTLFLLWVYARRHAHFARVRNALLAANYVSVVVLFVYPLAPPRLLPGGGFVDTLDANAVNLHSRLIDAFNDPYSAMPSLHASYALVIGIAGFALTRQVWLKALCCLYPPVVVFSVIATGNHFVLDVVGGALVLLATPVVTWVAERRGMPTVWRSIDGEASCSR
jgi:membrane-associated phospholipid phosphatase